MQRTRLVTGLITGLLILLLAACAPAPAGQPEASGETAASSGDAAAESQTQLRVGITGDESTLTPYTYVTGYPGWNLLLLQYDTLYQLAIDGSAQPWLVTDASYSEDGTVLTLDLRDDVLWHDGEAFTAEDVQFTVDYFNEFTQSRFTRALRPVVSAEAVSDTQVVLTLAAPTPLFELSVLADVPILPQHIWDGIESPDEFAPDGGNIGTGPYQLTEYVPEQFYRFEANADYFAGEPAVDELVAVIYADDVGSLIALQTNEIDMLVSPAPPEQIDMIQAGEGLAVAQGALFTTEMLNYDMSQPPFNEPAIRQAMTLAIDRQDLIDTVYLGAATPGSVGWIHPASPFFNADVVTEYDPDAARALLDEAGIVDSDGDGVRELNGEPLSVEFLTPSNRALRLRNAEIVSEMLLNELGIEATVNTVDQATWEDAVWPGFDVSQGRNYELSMWGWSAPIQANAVRITTMVHSDPALGSLNLTGYDSPEMNALAEQLSVAVDPDEFNQTLDQIQAQVAQDLPFILLLYPDGSYAYNPATYDGWGFMAGQGIFHKLSLLPESARP